MLEHGYTYARRGFIALSLPLEERDIDGFASAVEAFFAEADPTAPARADRSVTSSTKLPSARFSTPLRESEPVAPASFPLEAETGPEAVNAPSATSSVPATVTVSVPRFTVKTTVPAIDATVPEKPVTRSCPASSPAASRRP